MKVKSESEVAQSCPTLSDPMDCSPPGSSVYGIFQAGVLEWGATAFSNYCTVILLSYASKVMLKILQVRLQQYMNWELPYVQAGFRKGRGTREQIANIPWIIEKHLSLLHWKKPWCWEKLKVGGKGDGRGWDGWMASPTQWTWVWLNSRSWWWTGRPGVLQSMGLQRVGHDWVTELNWTERIPECPQKWWVLMLGLQINFGE